MVNSEIEPQQPLFVKGTQVEVSRDNEGRKGAWYSATIVEYPPKSLSKKRKKAIVEYKDLFTEDGSTPLTEHIDPAYIRPLPPNQNTEVAFEDCDPVEAFFSGGWWIGVVRKVLGNSKYVVYLANPPDVIEFERTDMRPQLNWVDGKWIESKKQQPTGSIFSSGTSVEVNTNEENLRDVWFRAIVIKENKDKTFLVKYLRSMHSNDVRTVKKDVDLLHIRPSPPSYVDRDYELLERVDTVYEGGWRVGVITKVLAGRRYIVFFKHGNEDKELNHSDIRPHVEWADGNWVTRIGKSKEVSATLDGQEHLGHANNGNFPEVHKSLCSPKGSPEIYTLLSRNKKIKLGACNGKAEFANPSKELNEGNSAVVPGPTKDGQVSNTLNERSMEELNHSFSTPKRGSSTQKRGSSISRRGSAISGRGSSTAGRGSSMPMRGSSMPMRGSSMPMRDSSTPMRGSVAHKRGSGLRTLGKHSIGDQPSAKCESLSAITTTKEEKARIVKLQMGGPLDIVRPLDIVTGGQNSEGISVGIEIMDDGGKGKEDHVPLILGLKAKGTKGSRMETPMEIPSEELLNLMREKDNLNASAGYKSMEQISIGSSQRRKRGRPRKLVILSSPSKAGKVYKGDGIFSDGIVEKDLLTKEGEQPTLSNVEFAAPQDIHGHRQKAAGTLVTDRNTKETDRNIAEEDQPLSMWIGGIHSAEQSSSRNVNGIVDARLKQAGLEKESPEVIPDDYKMPFVKKSPIWKSIESMEIFKLIPQNPHFRPLYENREEYREGAAIGFMVTFTSTCDNIALLRLEDPETIFQSILESLQELEKHGFDVAVLKSRMNELQSIKKENRQILDESKEAERKVTKLTEEKTKYDEQMEDIRRSISNLEEQYLIVKSKKEASENEITRLQFSSSDLNGKFQNMQSEFQEVASAPWIST